MSVALRPILRLVSIATICTCALLLGIALVLGHHYSVTVRNIGSKRIVVDVSFSEGVSRRWTLEPSGESCLASWVDTDGSLSIRVGHHQDDLYVAADMGANITAEISESSVHILESASGLFAWRQCWWP